MCQARWPFYLIRIAPAVTCVSLININFCITPDYYQHVRHFRITCPDYNLPTISYCTCTSTDTCEAKTSEFQIYFILRQADHSFSFENMVYLCAHHTSAVGTFFLPDLVAIWGAQALPLSHALEAPQRQIWEFSTRTLNLFDSTPLHCETFRWLHFNHALRFSMHILKSLFDLTLFGF